ncbi:DUF1015 domain-containing protein [Clostridium manihotivorum]|uniref:DUF1015 domain-containing protein n=1 Tax=Clostridium manihotivorum TaxID=2320868 RepID=A0A3R5QQE6_9CLOT|nr:DUF1015 family protein [Clostridium manihotivorum]QAA30253.1 DUF1015 domain-containing protein [Clostridium manihotivorum]
MAVIRPFKAVRPVRAFADRVAALPYDVMNSEEARIMVRDNEYSFLHVDKAEVNLDPSVDIYDESVYKKAKEVLDSMEKKSILIQDEEPYLYIYRQTMNGRSQTGLVSCVSIDDYLNNVIKKHEFTRPDKEQDRIKHVDVCDANTGPIFLTYRDNDNISTLIDGWTEKKPEYDFISEDGIGHMVWKIDDSISIQSLKDHFSKVDYLYIADGHHRAASAVKVGLRRREEYKNFNGQEEFNFFLAVLFPESNLNIMDYNRVVKDLNGLSNEDFLSKIKEKFSVTTIEGGKQYKPQSKRSFGMFLDGTWYKLEAKSGSFDAEDPVKSLDVSILQDNLLSPILDIKDPRSDKRIDFVGGIRGLDELEKRASSDMKVAFSMYPTSMKEIMDIADSGDVMPPKSTWFEPKLRSGLFIHKLS